MRLIKAPLDSREIEEIGKYSYVSRLGVVCATAGVDGKILNVELAQSIDLRIAELTVVVAPLVRG